MRVLGTRHSERGVSRPRERRRTPVCGGLHAHGRLHGYRHTASRSLCWYTHACAHACARDHVHVHVVRAGMCKLAVAVVKPGLAQMLLDHARGGVRDGALLRREQFDVDGSSEERCEACDDDVGVGDHLRWTRISLRHCTRALAVCIVHSTNCTSSPTSTNGIWFFGPNLWP